MREGGADLNRHALSAGASAEQVRDPRASHDEGDEAQGNFGFRAVADVEHEAHAPSGVLAEAAVRPCDHRACKGEKRDELTGMRVAERGDGEQHAAEQRVDGADRDADGYTDEGEYRDGPIGFSYTHETPSRRRHCLERCHFCP